MNRLRIGNQYQDYCQKWIEETWRGAVVHNQKSVSTRVTLKGGRSMWVSKRNDVWGCLDLLVITPSGQLMFIQCTAHKGVKKRLDQFKKVPWPLHRCMVQLWQKKSERGRTVIQQLFRVEDKFELRVIGEIKNRKYIPTPHDKIK
jgi:hypothetical protein